jgi:ribonucleoside-triphosphate reductase (thioredoxin)
MNSTGVNDLYSQFVYVSRYSRWLYDLERRETWPETVDRYMKFFAPRIPAKLRKKVAKELRDAIFNMEVMPSMRAIMTAGEALEKDNCAGYNCSYVCLNDQRAFDEAMYISMCGTGVGFSVERQYINELPTVAENFYPSNVTLKVKDSKIGWSTSFKELIALLYTGMVPKWDLSELRPAGAPLKTFGGRSSGPAPLDELFKFTVETFKRAAGRKLTSIECHDIMCKVGDIVVVGGVRRSAMISLSNLSDDRMRAAKTGDWGNITPHRRLANNSAVYTERPDIGIFMKEWLSLYDSKSGERGIFNRQAATLQAKATGRRKFDKIEFGTNPCGEIILRNMGFCNLTEVVIRPEDTAKSLRRKVRLATILGTLQSTLTNFRYLRAGWKKNAEEERLLGVSLTGIMDNPITANPHESLLKSLKQVAIATNKQWSKRLGIAQAAAVTCIKPSGTVSQLVNSSSGIHPRYDIYYIRGVQQDRRDPISALMKECKIPNEPLATKPDDVDVFYFPIKSPAHSVTRLDLGAISQLEVYLKYRRYWCEHNPSCTVYVKESEWLAVGAWVYEHFNDIGGIAFLPYDDHIYKQAPYTPIDKEGYEKAVAGFPTVDWLRLTQFEKDDRTLGAQELACQAGVCEL